MSKEENQYLFSIIYCNNRNDVTDSLIKDSDLSDIKTFGYKSKCWKYEKEWRYSICVDNIERKNFVNLNAYINAVYVGANCKGKEFDEISEICMEKKINQYQMILDKKTYKLKKEQIKLSKNM